MIRLSEQLCVFIELYPKRLLLTRSKWLNDLEGFCLQYLDTLDIKDTTNVYEKYL